jgi:hypothetical protein
MALTAAQTTAAVKLGVAAFGAPISTYTTVFEAVLNSAEPFGGSIANTYNAFLTLVPPYENVTDSAFAATFVESLLGTTVTAEAKAAGVALVETLLAQGQTRGAVAEAVITALVDVANDDATWGAASARYENRVAVAEYYTTTYAGTETDVAKLQAILATVTATTDVATDSAKLAIIDANIVADFTLTTKDDTIIGTAGNDLIKAPAGTLAATDLIIDQSTTDNDTLNITATAAVPAAKISNIENINVNWDAFGTATVDATNISGAKNLTVSSSKLGFLGNVDVIAAGANTVTAGAGAVGTLTVSGGTSAVVNAGAAKTVVVNPIGDATKALSATVTAGATTESITVGAFKTTTVTGTDATKTITITGTPGATDVANVTVTKDASVTVAGAVLETLNITAADGNKVTLAAPAFLKDVAVTSTGKATLVVGSADITGMTVTNATTGLTIDLTSAAAADLTKVAFDTLNLKNALAGDVTVKTGANIKADVDLAANKILTADEATATADSVTLTLSVDQTALNVVDGNKTIETLNIASALKADDADKTLTIAALTAKNAVVTGADKVTVTSFTGESLTATALTGDLTVTQGGAAAATATVVGSATAKNTVTFIATTQNTAYVGGAGADIVTLAQTTGDSSTVLGNGANTFTATALTDGNAVVQGGTGVDTITVAATLDANIVVQAGGGDDVVTYGATTGLGTIELGAGNDKLTLSAGTIAGANLKIDGGEGTDTLVLNGKDISLGTVTVSNIEVIDAGVAASKVGASVLAGKSITIQGDGNIATKLLVDVTATTAGTYDFSGLTLDQTLTKGIGGLTVAGNTGADTIIGTVGNDSINGGNGNDVITGGKGVDALTGGAGNDTFVFAAGDSGTTAAAADTIADFTTAADKIKTGVAGTVGNFTTADATGMADLAAAVTAANAAFTATAGLQYYVAWDINNTSNGALIIDLDGNKSADMVIQLTGVDAANKVVFGDIIA